MRFSARFLAILALHVLLGCSEVGPATMAPLILNITSLDEPLGEQVALAGALLCESDTTNCKLSRANGQVTIQLPIGEETSITLVADEHAKYLVPVLVPTAAGWDNPFEMYSDEHMVAQFKRLMSPYPMVGTAAIVILVFPSREGASFELVNATGKPFYTDEQGLWSTELNETTEGHGRSVVGGFVDVPPGGEYWVQFGGTAQSCSTSWGWPGDDQNRFKVPVRAGYVSRLSVICPLP